MRLLLEKDDGTFVEIKEIEGVPDASNALLVMCDVHLKPDDARLIENSLSETTGKQCVILPPYIRKIFGV